MYRPDPGIVSAESEDQAGEGMGLEFRPPASTPGRDAPVQLGARFSRVLARSKGLNGSPALCRPGDLAVSSGSRVVGVAPTFPPIDGIRPHYRDRM